MEMRDTRFLTTSRAKGRRRRERERATRIYIYYYSEPIFIVTAANSQQG
jgi:hypothetical protein